jgi:hypothetical protein
MPALRGGLPRFAPIHGLIRTIEESRMKKIMTIVFATLFAASTGAFAAAHMKGDKDAPKADKKAETKKGGDMKKDEKAKK